jgi:hypothetical protein
MFSVQVDICVFVRLVATCEVVRKFSTKITITIISLEATPPPLFGITDSVTITSTRGVVPTMPPLDLGPRSGVRYTYP